MKKRTWKKTVVAAAMLCVLGSITVMALGKTEMIMIGSSRADVMTSYEESRKKQESLDGNVKMPETFRNGYAFQEAVPAHEVGKDKDGNITGEETVMHVTYAKEGKSDITLSASRISMGESGEPDQVLVLEDGTELHYREIVNKFVPEGYEITEEEQHLIEEGELNIAFGTEEVQEMFSSSVVWMQDGITYCLFTFSQEMSAEEMFEMAAEICDNVTV